MSMSGSSHVFNQKNCRHTASPIYSGLAAWDMQCVTTARRAASTIFLSVSTNSNSAYPPFWKTHSIAFQPRALSRVRVF